MTDTAKPIKGPILRGEYDECLGYDCMTGGVKIGPVYLDGAQYGQAQCEQISDDSKSQMMADADLIAEAFNAHTETGLTPRQLVGSLAQANACEAELRRQYRQLVEQRDGCVTLLRAVLNTIDESDHWWMDCTDRGEFDASGIRAIIAKVEAKS